MPESDDARNQAKAQFGSIKDLIDALQIAEESEDGTAPDPDYTGAPPIDADTIRERIQERPLSVQVRSPWYSPGEPPNKPAEYEILLCTGGPAVRLVGELDDYGQPDSADLEYQDWFKPWTPWRGEDPPDDYEETLLAFAQHFWFGE